MNDVEFDDSKKGLSIASMVLGIIGILLICTPIGGICGLIGLILGAVSYNKKQGIKGMAIAGIVLGIISVALWVIVFVIFTLILGMATSMASFA